MDQSKLKIEALKERPPANLDSLPAELAGQLVEHVRSWALAEKQSEKATGME